MSDDIENPKHYQFGQMEAWDIIELAIADLDDRVTAYHVASALKYLLRASRKNGDADVAKASAHLKRECARHVVSAPWCDPHGVAFGCSPPLTAVDVIAAACARDIADAVLREAQAQGDYGNPVAPGGTP